MSSPDIIKKLTREIENGVTTEPQVVYLLAGIRKLMERDDIQEDYRNLTFHCNWALHSKLSGQTAQHILRKFDAAHALLRDNQIELHDLPRDLHKEISTISTMRSFEKELSEVLAEYGLPKLNVKRSDGWASFLNLYAKVVEDIPLVVQDTFPDAAQHISEVVVNVSESVPVGERDRLFKVTWNIRDKSGQSGSIFVLNSFEM